MVISGYSHRNDCSGDVCLGWVMTGQEWWDIERKRFWDLMAKEFEEFHEEMMAKDAEFLEEVPLP